MKTYYLFFNTQTNGLFIDSSTKRRWGARNLKVSVEAESWIHAQALMFARLTPSQRAKFVLVNPGTQLSI